MGPDKVTHGHPREAVAERNLQAILDAAEQLLARGEVPAISAVAAEARVSRPTVYAHFPDRRHLVEAVVARTVNGAMEAIAAAEPERGPALEALHRLIAASWAQLSRHEQIRAAAARELSTAAMHRSHQAAIGVLHSLVDRGRGEAAFRTDLPAELLVTATLGLMHAVADAVQTGVLESDAARATARTLIAELWQAPPPASDEPGVHVRPASTVSE